ncbi:Gmad2 immunoglobulin-like domain-containing protein [Phycicoccus sp. SLBN-51]|uniref:Gmad2 immunoglobulin-like domain-containing protein n=1 Tax=Phycicoccus sp. SLBN-51 TaxID=2768447 RepID=UPI001151204C|nr:Gmad2 immunoglobulin-like domain-containing protein [Phycicoccus sp. SLBN-51]TQJ51310.1 sporulation and spore germination protein [Phycicoccus sp. SLBN-51]
MTSSGRPPGPDGQGSGAPDPELHHVEHRLRHALHHEAQRVRPSERLDHILAAGRQASRPEDQSPGHRRWVTPLAAAAAVAAIAGVMWGSTQTGQDDRDPAAAPVATSAAPSPSAKGGPGATASSGPSSASGSTASSAGTSAPATRRVALPAYFVGPVSGDRPVFRLFREFLPATLPTAATDGQKAKAAVALAMDAQRFSNTDGYLQPWTGTTVGDVTVTPRLITVRLSGPGAPGITDKDVARVAVQSLVWTAQAAVGKGTIPVTFTVADGETMLFGLFPAAQHYNRPPSSRSYDDLAPIWVTFPGRDATLPKGKPVVVKGEATVFEATVSWQLLKGTSAVGKGVATASIGAPGRGTFSFGLGSLAPGDYTIRVFEVSAADGTTVNAEKRVSFSVR